MGRILLPAPGPHMIEKLEDGSRHKVICAGRRWRKTTLCMLAAILGHGPNKSRRGLMQGGFVWWVTESYPVAESVWLAVSATLAPIAKHVSEKHYRVTLPNGGAITIKSAANPSALKGSLRGLDGVVLDEAAYHHPEVWAKRIRPALSDTHGWSLWASTPDGFNYFKDIYDTAAAGLEDWRAWHEPSSANPFWDPAEIDKSRQENVPEDEIQSEYYAQFVLSGAARTFHEFDREAHIRPQAYDPAAPLDLAVSFGVAPSAWVVCQGGPGLGPERIITELRPGGGISSVRDYLAEFRTRFPRHASSPNVRVFGIVDGQSSGHSDYELIRAGLHPQAKHFIQTDIDMKDRINAVNHALRTSEGDVAATIDPSAEFLIRDLEATRNTDASFRVNREPGLGHYAYAWASKLTWVYPLVRETVRAHASWSNRPESTPEARLAQGRLNRAVRDGKIQKPNECEECHQRGYVEGAHFDYLPQNALKVRWLCRRCHLSWDLSQPKGGTVARH